MLKIDLEYKWDCLIAPVEWERPDGDKSKETAREYPVMVFANDKLEVIRMAPQKKAESLPFSVWMALAKATLSVSAFSEGAQVSL